MPLDEQDTAIWNAMMIAEADGLLRKAGGFDRFGPFQCQAAIQSVHAARRLSGATDWQALTTLYAALVTMKPTLGARVARAAVLGRSLSAAAGLEQLDRLDPGEVAAYQPYWAVRAFLLARAGDNAAAIEAYVTATGLSESPAVRDFLTDRLKQARQATSD
ncbi:RNA polymerase sigma factor domain-containing protein [Rhizobium sp. N4311]|nr:RNA polymerase sigma factor domain-containing protein [Rhizobium sp. N4311]